MRSKKLPKAVRSQVESLSEEGNKLADAGKYRDARAKFVAALELVPEPETDYAETTWLIAGIGDALFFEKKYEPSFDAFQDAVRCIGGLGNPFIHLRLGECALELGDEKRAGDELARAYMGGGREVFDKEDPKYFALVEKLLKPPVGQDRL